MDYAFDMRIYQWLAPCCLLIFSLHASHSLSNDKPLSIVYLNSYHPGYEWSDRCLNIFKKKLKTNANIHVFYMDTKINHSQANFKEVTQQALAFIQDKQPHLIVAAEDNASKLLIEPYFKNVQIPVVFMGVNVDASIYGYPYDNATGIVEMDGILNLVHAIRPMGLKKEVGMIFSKTVTGTKVMDFIKAQQPKNFETRQVKNAQQWFEVMTEFNTSKDFIALDTISAIQGLDHKMALNFIKQHIQIPIISASSTSRHLAHVGYITSPEEQGIWTARTVDNILSGKSINDIPLHISAQYSMYINQTLLNEMSLVLPKQLYKLPHRTLKQLDEKR